MEFGFCILEFKPLGVWIFIADPLVQSNAQHEENAQYENPNNPVDPVEGILKNDQKGNGEEHQSGYLVPNTHIIGAILHLIPLQLFEHLMTF